MSTSPETEAPHRLTAGQMLQQARLKAGADLSVLSVQLKVPVKQLEDLEADLLDPVKGPVFYRSLTASVCRHLGVDSAPILQLLPRLSGQLEPLKQLHLSSGSSAAKFKRHSAYRQFFPSRFVWLGVFLLGLTFFFVGMPFTASWTEQLLHRFSFFEQTPEEQVTQEISLQLPSTGQMGNAPSTDLNQLPSASSAPPATQTAASSSLMPSHQESPTTNTNRVQEPASSSMAEWQFTARAESWLELRNSKNSVIWSGVLKAGDIQTIESPLPVRVVVGRAPVVSVTLRGQVFDLKPHTRANAARFEVKE